MKKTNLRNKGITLIALVVTIIVLLILAGVTISTLFGDNGIISAARKAAEDTKKREEDVGKQLEDLADEMQSQITGPVVGTREDWNVSEDGRLGLYKGAIPEDGTIIVPSIVDGIKITRIEASKDDIDSDGNANTSSGGYRICNNILYRANEFQAHQIYNSSIRKLIISEGTTLIEGHAFGRSTALTDVKLPNSLTEIKLEAFRGCSKLENVKFGNGLIKIESGAFLECNNITNIMIPSSVTSIDMNAFERTGLNSIKVEEDNTVYDSRNNCNAIIETASNNLIYGCKNTTIPSSITSIGAHAFNGCTGLTNITIPNSVTSIEDFAFGGCTGLTNITIPNSVTGIEDFVFYGCSGLTSITIPNSVTSIGNYAFNNCTNLTTVNYTGTKAQWNAITKADGNTALTNAKIHCTDGDIN